MWKLVLFIFLMHLTASALIRGTPVEEKDFPEVISISAHDISPCSATIIGPRTVITAAHCVSHNEEIEFRVGKLSYTAVFHRSPLFESQGHDVALGITNTEIREVKPALVSGAAPFVGMRVTLAGYGCTRPEGGPLDGTLTIGENVIAKSSNFNVRTSSPSGAVICDGDPGGPMLRISEDGKHFLIGINSTSDLATNNLHVRIDSKETLTFIRDFTQEKNSRICGVNEEC